MGSCHVGLPRVLGCATDRYVLAGIGFAKTAEGNCQLIGGLDRVRAQLKGPFHNAPLLVGPSRKGFLGKITGNAVFAASVWNFLLNALLWR